MKTNLEMKAKQQRNQENAEHSKHPSANEMQALVGESKNMLALDWMQKKLEKRFKELEKKDYEPFTL